ncbi:KH domain-containing protein At4g18375 [Linum grandiflorum]
MAGQRNDYGKRSSNSNSDYGGGKRHNPSGDDSGDLPHGIGNDDTVYRYLCPVRKIGSIIGRGGEIAKQLRAESKSSIRISESIPGFDERIVTVYSTSEETNSFGGREEDEDEDEDGVGGGAGGGGDLVCPAQHALFLVHDRVVAEERGREEEEGEDDEDEAGEVQRKQVSVRMLVPSDQIGCVIGKGGQVIQGIRSETGAQIRILKDEHLPPFALTTDELLQIVGEPAVVRMALMQVATRLHENPSRFQHLLLSTSNNPYQSGGGMFVPPSAGVPAMGAYGGYKGGWPDSRDDAGSARDFAIRLVCPIGNIGSVIGKGGSIIKQIRQETRAGIKVDSSGADGDDCIIFISSKEVLEDQSPTINAALKMQPRCSEKSERDAGDSVLTTRILVPRSQVGCLMGKGGSIISEMRSVTRASIRILSEDNLPKVASEDDEMVQITGNHDVAGNALLQVLLRLKANVFGRDGALSSFQPALPYVPMPLEMSDGLIGSRDGQSRGSGYPSASGSYGSLHSSDSYASPLAGRESGYGAYGNVSSGRSSGAGYGFSIVGPKRLFPEKASRILVSNTRQQVVDLSFFPFPAVIR